MITPLQRPVDWNGRHYNSFEGLENKIRELFTSKFEMKIDSIECKYDCEHDFFHIWCWNDLKWELKEELTKFGEEIMLKRVTLYGHPDVFIFVEDGRTLDEYNSY